MKPVLRNAGEQFEILDRGDALMRLDNIDAAMQFLQQFVGDPIQMRLLREFAEGSIGQIWRKTDHEVIRVLAHEVSQGNVRFLKRAGVVSSRNSRLPDTGAQEGPMPPPTQPEQKKETAWIEIRLVDMNDEPVVGEKYKLELPDGSIKEGSLDAQGLARETGIEPGTAKVSFPNLDKDAWESV